MAERPDVCPGCNRPFASEEDRKIFPDKEDDADHLCWNSIVWEETCEPPEGWGEMVLRLQRERDRLEEQRLRLATRADSEVKQRMRVEARIERGGDLHALITSGHHLEVALRSMIDVTAIIPLDEHGMDAFNAGRTALYEWDKRARRSGVDWWNEREVQHG